VGVEGVNARMADIQSRIIALQTQSATPAAKTSTVAKTASTASGAGGTTFASHLSDAVANQKYTLNAQGVPTDLAAYGNGKIPAAALAQVGDTNARLWTPAAQSLTTMMADAKKDGVHIGISDSYRPYTEQVDLAKRKGLYSQGGLAAKPGTSEHGWGMAADLDLNSKALSWMKTNGAKYGFDQNVPRESWHWAYKPKSV
jgi:D-alanyl-D-alanine carboxypeptidase